MFSYFLLKLPSEKTVRVAYVRLIRQFVENEKSLIGNWYESNLIIKEISREQL